MVHDYYTDRIPTVEWGSPTGLKYNEYITPDLEALLKDFQQAIGAASVVDQKTGQPDCVDPEKAKLQERVKDLEALLAAPPEFVIVEGGGLPSGRYRVIDGKLYKAV